MRSPDFEPESLRDRTGWLVLKFESGDDLHVVPCDDALEHRRVACRCGPSTDEVISAVGVVSYIHTHNAADGRS